MEEENTPKTEPTVDGPKPPRKPPRVALDLLPPADDDGGSNRKSKSGSEKTQPAVPPSSVASETEVVCPGCHTAFPITPEIWGVAAECSECNMEFEIKAPPGKRGKSEPTSRA